MIWDKYHTETYAEVWQVVYDYNMSIEFDNAVGTVIVKIPEDNILVETNNIVNAIMQAKMAKERIDANGA